MVVTLNVIRDAGNLGPVTEGFGGGVRTQQRSSKVKKEANPHSSPPPKPSATAPGGGRGGLCTGT